jgi:hypothetical protein
MFSIKAELHLETLKAFVKSLTVRGKTHDAILLRWVVRYKKFLWARYNKFQKGGGDWAPLQSSTRKRTRRKNNRQILYDSGTMKEAIRPVKSLAGSPVPGASIRRTRQGVIVGYGGGAKHPYSKLSIARLAKVHQKKRPIIVEPDERVQRGMQKDVKTEIKKLKDDKGMS